MLAEHFPFDDDMAPLAERFNRIMNNRFYEVLAPELEEQVQGCRGRAQDLYLEEPPARR